MVSNYSINKKQDSCRCLFNMQIILISEKKNKCNSGFGLCLIVPSRFFKVTDGIGFTFVPYCDWFIKTSKCLREAIGSWLAEKW